MKRNEMIGEMVKNEFEVVSVLEKLSDENVEKKYKCFLSKKCLDEKFYRIKKMFEYVKDDKEFIDFIGKEEYNKLVESYGKKDKRGENYYKSYNDLDVLDVFMNEKLGVKEIIKKGYVVDMSCESKGMGIYRKK